MMSCHAILMGATIQRDADRPMSPSRGLPKRQPRPEPADDVDGLAICAGAHVLDSLILKALQRCPYVLTSWTCP